MKIISAETYRDFTRIVERHDLDRNKCVFAPIHSKEDRRFALAGRRVRSRYDLIGLFSSEEVIMLVQTSVTVTDILADLEAQMQSAKRVGVGTMVDPDRILALVAWVRKLNEATQPLEVERYLSSLSWFGDIRGFAEHLQKLLAGQLKEVASASQEDQHP